MGIIGCWFTIELWSSHPLAAWTPLARFFKEKIFSSHSSTQTVLSSSRGTDFRIGQLYWFCPQKQKGFPPTHHLRCKTTSTRNHKLHRMFVNVLKRQDFKQETDALHVPETPKLAFPHLLSENRKLQLEHLSSRLFEKLFRLKTDPSKFI